MNPESPSAALASLASALEAMQVPWFVSGSLASSLHGIPRSTNDVDVVADLPPAAAGELVSRLGDGYYADEGMIRQAFSRRGACNSPALGRFRRDNRPTGPRPDQPRRCPMIGYRITQNEPGDLPDGTGPKLAVTSRESEPFAG